jgi:hypothetical protein
MPSKLDDASNLRFLYACLQTCDFPAIDYHKVAKQFGIQAPAARMRLRRLRDSLEGKEGRSKVSKKQMGGDGRRKPRGGKKIQAKEGYEKKWNGPDGDDNDDDDDDEDVPLRSVKCGDRGSDAGLKQEGREEKNEDWKMLPESRPLVRPAVPQAQMYEASAFEPVDAKMPPAASPVRQMTLQVQPQMSMYNMAEPYRFPSAHVALPQMPYYQTSFSEYQPEQHQHRPQYEAATPSPDVQPDGKQPVFAEEASGEHVVDSK